MNCIAIAKSLTTYIPICQTNNFKLAEKAVDYLKKLDPSTVFTIVFGSDDYGVEAAENYLWE